jgi:hypothetical protein
MFALVRKLLPQSKSHLKLATTVWCDKLPENKLDELYDKNVNLSYCSSEYDFAVFEAYELAIDKTRDSVDPDYIATYVIANRGLKQLRAKYG